MNRFCFPILLVISMLACTLACSVTEPKHEPTEWSDIWIDEAIRKDLPRILLVGDSIVKGYYSGVKNQFSGRAVCARYATSKFLGDPDYLAELGLILKGYDLEVIHINNGLHGWDYTEEEYSEGLHGLLRLLDRHAPDAVVIWCMTTPVRKRENIAEFESAKNDRVLQRNRLAADIMTSRKIQINDLYEALKDHPEYYAKDGVHYNNEGKTAQAAKVTEIIEKNL